MTSERAETIKTPSELRIRQLLGQGKSNDVIRERLFPQIESLGGLEITPEELVENLITRTSAVAKDPDLIIGVLAYNYVPKFINILVDEARRDQVFDLYADELEKLKEQNTIS